MNKDELDDHMENSCLGRMVKCTYCPQMINVSEHEEHVKGCASRTAECD